MAVDVQELVRVKNRILGVLLRDARQSSGRSLSDCAALLGIDEDVYHAYEAGLQAPSLPQLEVLAYYFNVPLGYFWGTETLSSRRDEEELKQRVPELLMLRQRIIGVKLRKLREEAGLSVIDLAANSGLSEQQITLAEQGAAALPTGELDLLVRALHSKIEALIDGHGTIGNWILSQEEYESFAELPPDLREFILKPINRSYIDLARRLSRMQVDELRTIAESILEITY
jgi:transcriptional regulator with XRE-family HTH domain